MKPHKCFTCGETNPAKFYGHKRSACGVCHNKDVIERGRAKKAFAVELLGGRCSQCGYNKCTAALEFHHLDPSIKDKNFTSMRGWSQERLTKELQGCILVCSNCHREIHNQDIV